MAFRIAVALLAFGIVCSFSGAVLRAAHSEDAVYGNEDLKRYAKPSDRKAPKTVPARSDDRKERARAIEEQKEKEYWCKRASAFRKRVEEANDAVREAEAKLAALGSTPSKDKTKDRKRAAQAQKSVDHARKELRERERDLSELEDEAHRKGVPPGWLRCQYTW